MSAFSKPGVERTLDALTVFWAFYEPVAGEIAAEMEAASVSSDVAGVERLPGPREVWRRTRQAFEMQREAVAPGGWDEYLSAVRELGGWFAHLGVAFSAWFGALATFRDRLGVRLLALARDDVERAALALEGLAHVSDTLTTTLSEAYLQAGARYTADHAAVHLALGDAESVCRRVLEAIGDGVVVTDLAGQVVMLNPAGERLLGRKALHACLPGVDLILFRTDEVTPLLLPEHPLSRALAGARIEETRVYARGCQIPGGVHLLVSAEPLRREDRLVGAVLVFRDVTARLAAENDARHAGERHGRARKLDALGQLAGGIIHDFNNILSVIASYASLLSNDLPPDDPRAEDVEEIARAARSGASLTRQLLAFSRAQVLQPQLVELNGIVEETAAMLRRTIAADIRLATSLAGDLGRVRADRGQIQQILLNLVVNGRDAMPNGGRLTIETRNVDVDDSEGMLHSALPPGGWVLLAVTDCGVGMDASTLDRIFEPFFTTKEPGRGTGLGLATVYGIVRQFGGEVLAHSEVGVGTSIKVYLPRVQGEAEAESPSSHVDDAVRHGTILLVEDSEAVRRVAARVLRGAGYDVLEAGSGAEARASSDAHAGRIDLLLADIGLPGGVTGPDLAEQLLARRPDMHILLVSGYAAAGITYAGVLSPSVPFLEKPFTAAELKHRVRQALESSATVRPVARTVVPPSRLVGSRRGPGGAP